MNLFEEHYATLQAVVQEKLSNASGCHDYDHTLRVCRNAELLAAELPAADLRIVRLAALLHDIARPEEMAAKGTLCHAELGAEIVKKLLVERFEPDFADRVSAAVRTHRYRDDNRPQTLEAEIVYDADKLDSLGAVGVGRAFLFAGRENAIRENRDIGSSSRIFERMDKRQKIADTDIGRSLQEQIDDLLALLSAFRSGAIAEQHKR